MSPTVSLTADSSYAPAIVALNELFSKLRMDAVYVGNVAISAWLGGIVDSGAIDLLALVTPDRSEQIPMMASNRGFHVDRDAVVAASELDLIPMAFPAARPEIRIHVLMASNALYSRMISGATEVEFSVAPASSRPVGVGDDDPAAPASGRPTGTLRVVSPEDLGLLLLMADDEERLDQLIESVGDVFDVQRFNANLARIGLGERVLRRR